MPASVYLLIVLGLHLVTSVMIPPKIKKQGSKDIFYKPGETVKMECEASGTPQPSFFWRRADMMFSPEGNDDRIVIQKGLGTLIINNPEDKDEGIYQCFATNSQGTAATRKFNLKMVKLDEFITSSPIIHTPQLGAPLRMNCQSPDSVPDAQIYWAIADMGTMQPVFWDNRITMDYEDRLYFTFVDEVDHQDGRPYHCVAYNSIMRMSVIGPPQYINPLGNSVMTAPMTKLWPTSRFDEQGLVGSEFKLKCIFSGNPSPIVMWKRKDEQPFNNRVLQGNSGGQELVIRDLQFEDAGTYLCDANREQESTRLEMSVNLNVNSRPEWKSQPSDVSIGENGTAQFDCLAEGVPQPQIFWFVNGEPLETALRNDKRLDNRFHHLTQGTIVLEKVTKQDTMVFQCNVTNLHGYLWAEAFLNVLSEAPTILEKPRDTKVAEGQPFEMACEVTGKPDPIITWYRNEQRVTGGRYIINETGSLFAKTAVLSDAGDYRCEAQNAYGRVESLGRLIVRRKTVIQWMPMDLEVQRGVNAKFTCSGTTDPEETTELTTTWLKDGNPVELDTRMFLNLQDHSLTISGSEQRDTGTYTCVISNGLDSDSSSARLVVTDIPDVPYDVKIREECLKGKKAEVNWIAGSFNNAPIEYFVIEYVTKVDPNRWVFATHVDYRKDTAFVELAAGMDYSFRVISYNKIGASNPSDPSTTSCVTTTSTPSQNPRNVRTIGDKRGMLHIVWTPVPPEKQGGKNFTYIIMIQREGDPENSFFTKKILDWRVYEFLYDATGVDYTRYKITVKSRNVEGDSIEAAPVVYGYSSEGAPLVSPTNLNVLDIQADRALFTWQFDRSEIGKINSNIRGEFRGFKIQFWEQGSQAETIREYDVSPEMALSNSTSDIFSAQVPYLMSNTRLQARVAVLNNFFVSTPSEVFAFVTPPGLPGPVELLEDLNIGDNHVNLQWRIPLDNRGDILGYDIGYQEVRGLRIGEMQERSPQVDDPYATTAMLSGLKPNTNYRIHIWARTIGGRGEDFFIERTTDNPGVPMIPRFTISSVGTNYINVTWWRDAYQRSGSVVYVEHKKEDGAEWFSTTPDVSRDWVKLDFLQAGMRYNVRIAVTNGETTRLSQIEDVVTDGAANAYDVVANLGWFLGMIFSILLEVTMVTLFVICYRRGFRLHSDNQEVRTYHDGSETYTGTHYNKEEFPRVSEDMGPEPGGFSNEIYKNGYNDDYEDNADGVDDEFDESSNRYGDESDAQDNYNYNNRTTSTFRTGNRSQNVAPPVSSDYEDYNLGGARDTSHNKSGHSDTDSYRQPRSSYSSDAEGGARYQDENPRGDRNREKEVRSRDYSENTDSTEHYRRQTNQRRQNESYPAGRRQDRHSPEDTQRRDDRQYSRYQQDTSDNDKYDDQHDDDYDSRSGHSHRSHDHEKCDNVVDELKRFSSGPSRESSQDNSQGHASTFV